MIYENVGGGLDRVELETDLQHVLTLHRLDSTVDTPRKELAGPHIFPPPRRLHSPKTRMSLSRCETSTSALCSHRTPAEDVGWKPG